MKIILFCALTLGAAIPAVSQQPFDLTSLDKLEAKAKSRTNITLDGQLLKLAAGFLDAASDKNMAPVKALVNNLKGIYVRGFEFDKDGQYTDADLEPLRAALRQAPWSRIVEVHEGREVSEIWVAQGPAGDKFSGVAIINAEPRDLTVVYVSGLIGADDIARLNGQFGINVGALESGALDNIGNKSKALKKKNAEPKK